MDKPESYYFGLAAALLALLGLCLFFSLCETGFSSLNRIKLKNMADASGRQKRRAARARLVLGLLDAYDKLLSSILIGNTLVNIAASALATALCISLFGSKGVSLATLSMTLIVLIFCEIAPKTLAKKSPELTALRTAPMLRFFIIIFTPLGYLAAVWQRAIVRLFPAKDGRAITENELLTFVEEVRQEGGINPQEERMIRQVIEFDDITAAEIFTPRIDVAAVSENSTPEEIDKVFAATGFSRLPVFRETVDSITGVILLKDFHHEVMTRRRPPAEIIKPVVFITKTMKIPALLQTLQKKHSHLAVVVDEFGGTLGIVTIEDIVEELVGEIWDEHDKVVEPFRRNEDGTYTVLGNVKFQDMLERVGAAAEYSPDDDGIPATTVGNWVLENSGGLPRAGEELSWRGLRISVSRVQKQRVMELTIE
ncbi:MAG: hemolysin family protein [Treponema sp.]|jgi:CBS domain containing-hemolysin-like protein|nr:hemolysin family protein [Treponema sp.]